LPWLESLTSELEMTVVVGTIESAGARFANNALIIGPQGHLATFTKLHLLNAVEKEWFVSGDLLPIVRSQGWTFGVGICYDLGFPEIFRTAAQHGADFFLLAVGGSGGPPGPESDQQDQVAMHKTLAMQLMPARAVDNALYIFYANQAGHSGNAHFPGFSLVVDPQGALIDEHLCGEGMTVTEISRATLDQAQRSGSFTAAETRPEIYAASTLVEEPERSQIT
jgi:predicted amidohydrolase